MLYFKTDGWQSRVPSHLLQDANQWRSYRNGVRDLLRVVRNKVSFYFIYFFDSKRYKNWILLEKTKAHHYRELPEDLKIEMGDVPNGLVRFFFFFTQWNSNIKFVLFLVICYGGMNDFLHCYYMCGVFIAIFVLQKLHFRNILTKILLIESWQN